MMEVPHYYVYFICFIVLFSFFSLLIYQNTKIKVESQILAMYVLVSILRSKNLLAFSFQGMLLWENKRFCGK